MMKRVRMLRTESGRYPDFFVQTGQYYCRTGQEYEVPAKLAEAWVRQGIAELVDKPKQKNTSTTVGSATPGKPTAKDVKTTTNAAAGSSEPGR